MLGVLFQSNLKRTLVSNTYSACLPVFSTSVFIQDAKTSRHA